MKNIPQRTLQYNIGLVKYENPHQRTVFDLTTIHSLLIDQNSKFIELRQLIANYNSSQIKGEVGRPHLQRSFIERLYKMLSQLTRIPIMQNQLKFLNKIYAWVFQQPNQNEDLNFDYSTNDKMRPGTGSTRTRPYSATYTKRSRPDSAIPSKPSIPSKKTIQNETINKKTMDNYPAVDFKQLKHGQKQFFLGHRTIHPEQERPRVRLKEYQRKVFYDEPDEDQIRLKQFGEEKKQNYMKPKLMQIPLQQQIPLQEEQKIEEGAPGQNVEGQAGQGQLDGQEGAGLGEQDVNIDDLVAGEEGELAAEQQEVEVVDKLRPRVKVYGNPLKPTPRQNRQNYQRGLTKEQLERQKATRLAEQEQMMSNMMKVWAAAKNRVKIEQRRRAESARIMTRNTGMQFQKYNKKPQQIFNGANVMDFTEPKIVQVKSNVRPSTAFKPQSKRVYNQSLQAALTTGKLSNHVNIKVQQNNFITQRPQNIERIGAFAAKPKKKTFEQILRQAEQKVCRETHEQIEQVKQKLTMNKIPLGANKIYKSLSHHQPEVSDGDFVGLITGQEMYKNPFFKVAKKKKKKKKK